MPFDFRLTVTLLVLIAPLKVMAEGAKNYESPPYHLAGITPTTIIDAIRFQDVLEEKRSQAVKLLGGSLVVELSEHQESELSGKRINIDKSLEELPNLIQQRIIGIEKRANDDEAKSYAKVERAREEQHAKYVLSLRGKLKPYLVRLEGRNKLIGMYSGWWSNETRLNVVNIIAYDGPEKQTTWPAIVYLEKMPDSIKEQQSYVEVESQKSISTHTK